MNRYLLKVNGELHCPRRIMSPQNAGEWEGGRLLLPRGTPVWVDTNDHAEEIGVGDEVWVWTHEGNGGRGLTARARVAAVEDSGGERAIVLRDVELPRRSLTLRQFGRGESGSAAIDRINRFRHRKAHQFDTASFDDFMRVVADRFELPAGGHEERGDARDAEVRRALSIEADDALERLQRRAEGGFSIREMRPAQAAFRAEQIARHGGRCLVTRCGIEDVLDAAHIVPWSGEEIWERPENGLLFRADIHRLFDRMLISIRPADGTLVLHPRLEATGYRKLSGKQVAHKAGHANLEFHFLSFEGSLQSA